PCSGSSNAGEYPLMKEETMAAVRIGMIGTGFIGGAFAEAVRGVEGIELAAVSATSEAAALAFAAKHAIPRAHADQESLAADETIDAVYIASPNSFHATQAIAMLRAGKHVLVEKPLALTTSQAQAMIAAAHAADRLLMEAFTAPFAPNIGAIREALPRIPQLRRAVFVKDQYSSRFDAYKAGTVLPAFNPAMGGGSIMDLGFYPVGLAVHLFGEPSSVRATGILLDSGADAQGTILLGYDGFEVVCLHSKVATCGIASEIAGELSVITLDDCSNPTRVEFASRGGSSSVATASRRPDATEDLTREGSGWNLAFEIAEFARLVGAGARTSTLHPATNSLATIRILEAARREVGVHFPADDH
ncbi:MAG: Gfo/Idh/MocA family oxidoreductase, partial [Propionicimonas sp.]